MDADMVKELEQIQKIYDLVVSFLVNYSFQLLGAVLVFCAGLFVAHKVSNGVLALCTRKQIDITLSRFIANIIRVIVLVMIGIVCLNLIGISVTPFVAAIGAASLGAGLAIQGLLANYCAGFNIIITRPFVVGDTILVQGVGGLVEDILLAHTILRNEDGVKITIPNRHIVGEIIHNSATYTLVEVSVGIAYSSDVDRVITLLDHTVNNALEGEQRPNIQVGIEQFGDSSVDIGIRLWADTDKAIATKFAINKLVWDTLKEHRIEIPFPQREVSIVQGSVA